MTRSPTSKNITIFEGPDGAGKSTLAQEYAALTGARYLHHGPYKEVGDGLARMFLESMLPALLGYQDVVLDRCWLSEPIYGAVFRGGEDRVGFARHRILERVALRCGAAVIRCLPPFEAVKATFNSRRAEEYLDTDLQLASVYARYRDGLSTELPLFHWDYTKHPGESATSQVHTLRGLLDREVAPWRRSGNHPVNLATSGNWDGKVVLVGEDFGPHKNGDALYQTPFGSLSNSGCSLWLAEQLGEYGISERELLWINADELARRPDFTEQHAKKTWIALGDLTRTTVHAMFTELDLMNKVNATSVPHPQYWKRFRSKQLYPLIPVLKELLS